MYLPHHTILSLNGLLSEKHAPIAVLFSCLYKLSWKWKTLFFSVHSFNKVACRHNVVRSGPQTVSQSLRAFHNVDV